MSVPVFVDTNILIYQQDISDPVKQLRADDWITFLARGRWARISFQVLQELYATLTRKLEPRFDPSEAQEIVRELAVWQPLAADLSILERSWLLQQRYSLSWWDGLVVASAQACECMVLLTEDLQHGQVLGSLQVINPFMSPDQAPVEILKALEK